MRACAFEIVRPTGAKAAQDEQRAFS